MRPCRKATAHGGGAAQACGGCCCQCCREKKEGRTWLARLTASLDACRGRGGHPWCCAAACWPVLVVVASLPRLEAVKRLVAVGMCKVARRVMGESGRAGAAGQRGRAIISYTRRRKGIMSVCSPLLSHSHPTTFSRTNHRKACLCFTSRVLKVCRRSSMLLRG